MQLLRLMETSGRGNTHTAELLQQQVFNAFEKDTK